MKFFFPVSATKQSLLVALGVGIGLSATAVLYAKKHATEENNALLAAPDDVKDEQDASTASGEETPPIVDETPVDEVSFDANRDDAATEKTRSVREMARYYAESAFATPTRETASSTPTAAVESHENVSVRAIAMYFDLRRSTCT